MRTTLRGLGLGLVILAIGCNNDEKTPVDAGVDTSVPDGGGGDGGLSSGLLDGPCDPIVPTQCGLPFPSNVYLAVDPTTPTGRRVAFPDEALPATVSGSPTTAAAFNTNDGFSPGASLLTHMPGAAATGLPTPSTIETSLDATSPTVVIEADTGIHVPHFTELDATTNNDERRTMIIRPVVRLKDGTRYIVAIRHVVDGSGQALAPTPAFQSLRDGTSSSEGSVELRRSLYADIFAKLASAGVAKDDLQLAWDFSTGSKEDHTQRLVTMRDKATTTVGAAGPTYVLDPPIDNPFSGNPYIARKITGRMTVPLFLDMADPGATINYGPDGLPAQNGTAEFRFEILIPTSAMNGEKAALLQYGHGLFGGIEEIENNALYLQRDLADQRHYVIFAVDWVGMSRPDRDYIASALLQGDFAVFSHLVDRLHQGMLNALLAMKMMVGAMANDPAVQVGGATVYDPAERYYYGNSQGGILGVTYMAATTDVTRGGLGVTGMPFVLLLSRSTGFAPFFTLFNALYADPIKSQILIGLAQQLWDRCDSNGYATYITDNLLPNTPDHDVIIQLAIGDKLVTPLGGHIVGRSVGAKLLDPPFRPIFGFESSATDVVGSALTEYDFGQPAQESPNTPPTSTVDTHEFPRRTPAAIEQLDAFLRTGTAHNYCGGVCSFSPPTIE